MYRYMHMFWVLYMCCFFLQRVGLCCLVLRGPVFVCVRIQRLNSWNHKRPRNTATETRQTKQITKHYNYETNRKYTVETWQANRGTTTQLTEHTWMSLLCCFDCNYLFCVWAKHTHTQKRARTSCAPTHICATKLNIFACVRTKRNLPVERQFRECVCMFGFVCGVCLTLSVRGHINCGRNNVAEFVRSLSASNEFSSFKRRSKTSAASSSAAAPPPAPPSSTGQTDSLHNIRAASQCAKHKHKHVLRAVERLCVRSSTKCAHTFNLFLWVYVCLFSC